MAGIDKKWEMGMVMFVYIEFFCGSIKGGECKDYNRMSNVVLIVLIGLGCVGRMATR